MKKPPPPTSDAAADLLGGLMRLAEHYKVNPVVAFATVTGVAVVVAKLSVGKHGERAAQHGKVGSRAHAR